MQPDDRCALSLQIACLRHFQSEALSVLVPAAVSGPAAVGKACDRLPQALRGSIEGRNARQCAGKLASAWAAWAVSLHWLHDAAQALGMGHSTGVLMNTPYPSVVPGRQWHAMKPVPCVWDDSIDSLGHSSACRQSCRQLRLVWCAAASDGFSLTSLYVDASASGYMAQGGLGQRRLRALCDGVERLSDARCHELLEALLRSCRGVAGGLQAAAAELACVEVRLPPLPCHLCCIKTCHPGEPHNATCLCVNSLAAPCRHKGVDGWPKGSSGLPWHYHGLAKLHMTKMSFS